MSALRSRT
jgi:hypothetical protein